MFKEEIAFIYKEKHRKPLEFFFWPDLARAQYAKLVISWLDAKPKNGKLVHKSSNPPNVSQARPIEYFRADLTQRVYNNGVQAKIVAYTTFFLSKIKHFKYLI